MPKCFVIKYEIHSTKQFSIFFLNLSRNFKKIFDIIQTASLLKYSHEYVFMFLKHLGFLDFPIPRGISVSDPSALQHNKTSSFSLLFFLHDMVPP